MIGLNKKTVDIYGQFPELKKIPNQSFPEFIFIIPDGNRRYAKEKGQPTIWGHKKGLDKIIELLRALRPLPIKIIGFWGFSSDNWKRNEAEVQGLMGIFELMLNKYLNELHENNCKFIHLGRKDRLPQRLVKKLQEAEEKTKENTGQIVCAALDFGGEDQMVRMLKKVQTLGKDVEITPELLNSLKDGEGVIPTADLIIRTSEIRTSDVGWLNGKNTILYFLPDKLFPNIGVKDLIDGINFFVETERRHGA